MGSVATGILQTPNTPLHSLAVGSKNQEADLRGLYIRSWAVFMAADGPEMFLIFTIQLCAFYVHSPCVFVRYFEFYPLQFK